MLNLENFVFHNIIFILIFLGAAIWSFRHYIHTEKGKYRWHAFLLRAPIVGKVVTKIAVARFSRTFASLMGSGVSVLDSLEITGKAVGNRVIQAELDEAAKAVKNGHPLSKQLLEAKHFPPIVGQMISVGEETGKVDEVLIKVAEFYEEEVDAAVGDLMTAMEPLMIVVLGVIVGGIVISMYLPIFTLVSQLSK